MVVKWWLDCGIVGGDRSGEVEVDDDATNEQIEEEVRQEVFNFIEWGWEKP